MTRTLVLLLLVACGVKEETPPQREQAKPSAPIRTDATAYIFREGGYGPEITIRTTFAPKSRTAYVIHCNGAITTGLQRLVDGKWVNAWMAATNGCSSRPIVLAPGQQHSTALTLRRGAGAVLQPRRDLDLIEPGTYRVIWHNVLTSVDVDARTFGDDLPIEERVSEPIVIAR